MLVAVDFSPRASPIPAIVAERRLRASVKTYRWRGSSPLPVEKLATG
jgi:hypothetical protein